MNTLQHASRGIRASHVSTRALLGALLALAVTGHTPAQTKPGERTPTRPAQGQVVQPKAAGPAIVNPVEIVQAKPAHPAPTGYEAWVGKKIVVARPGVKATYWDDHSKMVLSRDDTPLIATVLAFDRGNLEIEVPGGTAWHAPRNVLLLDQSLAHFDAMVKGNRNDSWPHMVRAFVWAELGEFESANRDAAAAVKMNPCAAWLANQGVIWGRQGELEKAAECLATAAKKDRRSGFAYRHLGFIHLRRNQPEEAVKAFTQAVEIDSLDIAAYGGLVQARADAGDFDGAVRSGNFAVKFAVTKGEPLCRRAYAQVRAGDYEMALSDANEAVKLEPKAAWAVNERGRVFLAMWELDKAEADFKTAVAFDSSAAYAVGNLGLVETARRNIEKAVGHFDQAHKIEPGTSWLVNSRGWVKFLGGDVEEAARDFEKAASLNPSDARPHANLALCWLAKGMTNKATDSAEKAVAALPKSALAKAVLARVLAARGETGKAVEAAAEAVRLDPRDEYAMNTQAWLWATLPDEKARSGKKAVALAAKLCDRSRMCNPEHLETLAAAHAEAGDFGKAVETQQKAIKGYGLTPEAVERCREQAVKKDAPAPEAWEVSVVARLTSYEGKTPFRLPNGR